MPFLRFSRDKRGYEYFSLVQPTTNRRGKVRTRVLYWYRTPPNVKVGREPFDEAVRRALEAQNPDISFDWPKIIATPIPSADTEKWRERRRQERAERVARQTDTDEDETPGGEVEGLSATAEPSAPLDAAEAHGPAESESPTPLVDAPIAQPGELQRGRRRGRGRRGRPDRPRNPDAAERPRPAELPVASEPGDSEEPQ